MALSKEQKKKIVENIKEKLKKQKAIFFVGVDGLKGREMLNIRRLLKKNNAQLVVAKKTLVNVAAKEEKIDFDFESISGEAGLVFSYGDQILPAKTIYDFNKINQKLSLIGAFLAGKILDKNELTALSQLPPKEALLAKLVGSLKSPIFGFHNVLAANLRNLVSVLSQIKK